MDTINDRFRKAREYLGLSQTDFASKANRTRSEIANIEYNKTSPKEEVIKAVCEKHKINRRFLESGELPIVLEDVDEETEYINSLLESDGDPFYDIIKAILQEYSKASKEDKEALKRFAKALTKK